jgi:hypothetical protein
MTDDHYPCIFCMRILKAEEGVFVHDAVPHPEDYVYERPEHEVKQ